METNQLRSVLPGLDESLNPALRYQGSFLDLSGDVHVDHNGIWRKEKKEQEVTNTYKIEDDKGRDSRTFIRMHTHLCYFI